MQFTQNRNIKQRLVKYLREIYKLNNEWLNEDLEVITLTEGNSPVIYEHYPWDNENYPIVAIGGTGGTQDDWAIDSYLQNIWRKQYIGSLPRDYIELSPTTVVAFGVKVSQYDFKIRTINVALKQASDCNYDINVSLMTSSESSPSSVVSSGSISAEDITTNLTWGITELVPEYTLAKDTEYFVKLNLTDGSYGTYYLMMDNAPDALRTPFSCLATSGSLGWVTTLGITPLALLQGPVHQQLGGGIHANYSLYIEAKDLASTQKIAELTFVYLNLLRHANVQREIKMNYPNTTRMEFDRMSNLDDLGITIININKSNESVRERGNDRLFSITLDVSCYGRWLETFEMPTLQRIEEIIENY